jgi:hypothetical protein
LFEEKSIVDTVKTPPTVNLLWVGVRVASDIYGFWVRVRKEENEQVIFEFFSFFSTQQHQTKWTNMKKVIAISITDHQTEDVTSWSFLLVCNSFIPLNFNLCFSFWVFILVVYYLFIFFLLIVSLHNFIWLLMFYFYTHVFTIKFDFFFSGSV